MKLSNSLLLSVFNIIILVILVITVSGADWIKIDRPCLCQEFRCDNGTICLKAHQVCNGVNECPNGEEEWKNSVDECHPQNQPKCGSDKFRCKFSGKCIKFTQVCDGVVDCWGGVDEGIDFCEYVYSDSENEKKSS